MFKSLRRFASAAAVIAITAGGGITLVAVNHAGALITFTVNDAADAHLGNSLDTNCASTDLIGETETPTCTLRAAIEAADNIAGTDTVSIILPASNGVGIFNAAPTYALTLGEQLDVFGVTVTVTGDGQSSTVIDGQSNGLRVLEIRQDATATITGVTIQHGSPEGGQGGGIDNEGTLTLRDSTVTNNTAGGGGGIAQDTTSDVSPSTTLINDTITNNTSTGTGTGHDGGGFLAYNGDSANVSPTTTITNTTISNNSSVQNGGGIAIDSGVPDALTITGSHVDNNTANETCGECTASDGEGGGLFVINNDLATIAVTGSSFSSNSAYDGGGIAVNTGAYATFTIASSTINDNSVTEGGGGVYDDNESTPPLSISTSTISGNSASGLSGDSFTGDGGGFLDTFCSPVSLTNDTLTDNTASNNGGGFDSEACNLESVRTQPAGTAAHVQLPHQLSDAVDLFTFDTFNHNSAGSSTGAGNIQQSDVSSNITLGESIVANGVVNAAPGANCLPLAAGFTSAGYNLISDSSCGTAGPGDIVGHDPLLGALANNGGPTLTELPGTGSLAIGGVPNAACTATGITVDQRGLTRPGGMNGTCTIGAVEIQAATPPPPPPFNPNGYRMGANEGGVFDFGVQFHGSLAGVTLDAPIVGIANSPGPNGYFLVGADGGVFALGGAVYHGSLGGQKLPFPIAAIAATPDGNGYWLASSAGVIYAFGVAPALPAVQLPPGAHLVGIASTNSGHGLWLTDNMGDVYTLGDAQYLGSLGGQHLNAAIVGIAPAATGQGYILAAADGGAFAFGVGFFGSVPGVLAHGQHLNAPVVGIAETHSGMGYWMVGADGGVFCFGDAPFLGSIYTQLMPGQHLNGPIIGIQHLGETAPG